MPWDLEIWILYYVMLCYIMTSNVFICNSNFDFHDVCMFSVKQLWVYIYTVLSVNEYTPFEK